MTWKKPLEAIKCWELRARAILGSGTSSVSLHATRPGPSTVCRQRELLCAGGICSDHVQAITFVRAGSQALCAQLSRDQAAKPPPPRGRWLFREPSRRHASSGMRDARPAPPPLNHHCGCLVLLRLRANSCPYSLQLLSLHLCCSSAPPPDISFFSCSVPHYAVV